jgi:hypothetical protein
MAHDEGRRCVCVTEHRPRYDELHAHHTWPLSEGGPDTDENLTWLCPTQHANVHELWRHYAAHMGRPPWEVRRNYSHYCREVVEHGWYQAHPEEQL